MKERLLDNLILNGNVGTMSLEDLRESILSIISPKVKACLLVAFMTSISGLSASAEESRFNVDFNRQHTELLQGLKLHNVSLSDVKLQMLTRLEELTKIQQTQGVSPVDSQIASIARQIIESADDEALLLWILFPDTNGALSMDLKKDSGKTGNISIGLDGFSYYLQSANRFGMRDDSMLSVSDIVTFINSVPSIA